MQICKRLTILLILLIAISAQAAENVQSLMSSIEGFRVESGFLRTTSTSDEFSIDVLLLEMKLRLVRGEQNQFDHLFLLMKRYFLSPLGVTYRKLKRDLTPAVYENSTLDDLNACKLLLDAEERWPGKNYGKTAQKLAERILHYDVREGLLVDGTSWKERSWHFHSVYGPKPVLSLCTVDMRLLLKLQTLFPLWGPVVQRSLGVLMAGCGGPLPQQGYNLEKHSYTGPVDDDYQYLMTLVHLADGGFAPRTAVENLRRMVLKDPFKLPMSKRDSIAVGVLSAIVLDANGDRDLARAVLKALVSRFSIERNYGSGLLGTFNTNVSVRDNLLYLLACERFEQDDKKQK